MGPRHGACYRPARPAVPYPMCRSSNEAGIDLQRTTEAPRTAGAGGANQGMVHMRTLKFALATAIAAFAMNANAQARVGMSIVGGDAAHTAPLGTYQPSIGIPNSVD